MVWAPLVCSAVVGNTLYLLVVDTVKYLRYKTESQVLSIRKTKIVGGKGEIYSNFTGQFIYTYIYIFCNYEAPTHESARSSGVVVQLYQ